MINYNEWAEEVGARVIHSAWRDAMIGQGREVAEERLEWDTLPEQDRELDKQIAKKLLSRFMKASGVMLSPSNVVVLGVDEKAAKEAGEAPVLVVFSAAFENKGGVRNVFSHTFLTSDFETTQRRVSEFRDFMKLEGYEPVESISSQLRLINYLDFHVSSFFTTEDE